MIKYMKDLATELKKIHEDNRIHRDLNPKNIKEGEINELTIDNSDKSLEIGSSDNELVGSPNYIAPEIYENELNPPYSFASDIFSLGCIFYEIYTLKMLYKGNNIEEIKNEILKNKEIYFERNNLKRDSSVENLIKRMLEKNPNDRIEMSEIEIRLDIIEKDMKMNSGPIVKEVKSESDSFSKAIGFFIQNKHFGFYTLKKICEMSIEEFKSYWSDDYAVRMFPNKDVYELFDQRDKYSHYLNRLLYLIMNLEGDRSKEVIESINNFLEYVELTELKFNVDLNVSAEKRNKMNLKYQNTVKIYQLGKERPMRFFHLKDVYLEDCPLQVTTLYYELPDKGNKLLSVNLEPEFIYLDGRKIVGSDGLDKALLDKIKECRWWNDNNSEFIDIPVFRKTSMNDFWIFEGNVAIASKYKDIIHNLYYSINSKGRRLISVKEEPNKYDLKSEKVKGAEGLSEIDGFEEYLKSISEYGWWKNPVKSEN